MKIFFVFLFAIILFGFGAANTVDAQTLAEEINQQNQAFAGKSGADLSAADPRLVVGQIIKILLGITGTVFTCWTFYGGFLIFTSAGDSEKIEHAKSIITNGVIGIIIVLSSYSITLFITNLWKKAQQDPKADKFEVYVEPDTDFFNKDPLQQNTALPE